MAGILTGVDIKKGKKGEIRRTTLTQPLQFLPREEKDEDWTYDNADFWEWQSLRQIFKKAPLLAKNYNLANGIIDKSDYVGGSTNENKDLLAKLLSADEHDSDYLDLKFYPIIPHFVNTLCTEFSKRNTKIMFMTADEYSYNEMLSMKEQEISDVLLKEAEQKMLEKLISEGHDPNNPDEQSLFQQQLDQNNLKSLSEIEGYYNKNYRSMIEEWASHQHKEDEYRFSMDELEERNFRNSLITDSEYWHFPMYEDDYGVEIWNPMFTSVFKSPESRFTSQAHAVTNITLMTIPDSVDRYGYLMTQDQLESLQLVLPSTNAAYPITGYSKDSYYDTTKSIAQNDEFSLGMKQNLAMMEGQGSDLLSRLMSQTDYVTNGQNYLLRVSTGYWKSQRKVGHLTQVKDTGEVVTKIVDESYNVTSIPVYNNTLIQNRNPMTLIYGEHIDWTWIPEVYGYTKIGPNIPSYATMPSAMGMSGLKPIYLGINQSKIGPLKFQLKGEKSIYGAKIPVEGATFSDYNTRSTCPVDLLKPFQIGYNVANNQIMDITMDELGVVITLDPNQLPQKSLGEDWGKGNYSKAYVAMKNFGVLPLDRSLANTEGAGSSQSEARVLDLSQTNRLVSRIQMAQYFKNEGLGLFGITPQRLGQPVSRQTATGVEESMNGAYAQTEKYFTQHSNYLMPRVHQMRTDIAQFYQSTKPSVRLNYLTSKEEKVNFQINGADLLLRDFNVYCVSTAANNSVVEELRKLLITNNTAGASVFELGNLLTADSLGEMNSILKGIEKKADQQRQEEFQKEQELQKQKDEAALQEQKLLLDAQAREAELNRRRDVLVAEIRAAGYSGSVDLNANDQNDFQDNLDQIQKQQDYQDSMNFEREKETNRNVLNKDKSTLEHDKLDAQLKAKQIDLEIARENKNVSDLEAQKLRKKKEAEKKKSTK